MTQSLLTPMEAAKALGLPLRTLTFWRHKRKGPRFYKVGRHVRYDKYDIDEYLLKSIVKTGEL